MLRDEYGNVRPRVWVSLAFAYWVLWMLSWGGFVGWVNPHYGPQLAPQYCNEDGLMGMMESTIPGMPFLMPFLTGGYQRGFKWTCP